MAYIPVPKYIFWTPGIPMTINSKKVESIVKQILVSEIEPYRSD